jgi:hypothetical protein
MLICSQVCPVPSHPSAPASPDGDIPRLQRLVMAAATPVEKEESQSPYSNIEPEPGKSNPFACNVCKRNYSRVDHLARYAITPIPCCRPGLTILETLPLTFVTNIAPFLHSLTDLSQIHARSLSSAKLAARHLLERKSFTL